MTVEPVNEIPQVSRTKPEKAEYKAIRDILREPENVGKAHILEHDMFGQDATKMATAIKKTPGGEFFACVRSFNLPEGVKPAAVYGGYQLSPEEIAKAKGRSSKINPD